MTLFDDQRVGTLAMELVVMEEEEVLSNSKLMLGRVLEEQAQLTTL
jgi:hypothetical protein